MNPSLTTGLFGTITAWHNGKAATVELTERNATCKTIATKNSATISVAPTLAHEAIWIQNPSDKPHNLLIVNALGQTVSHAVAQANDVTEVDITAFSNGLYFVKNTQGGEVVRFVKQ